MKKRTVQRFIFMLILCGLLFWEVTNFIFKNVDKIQDFMRGFVDGWNSVSEEQEKIMISDTSIYIISRILVVLILLLFFLIFRKLVSNPLKKLTEGMEKVEQGDLEIHLEEVDSFEFGRLEKGFNTMVDGLKNARDLQEKNAEKNRRIYAEIAHDLKTPMTMILGYAKLLKGENCTKEQKEEYLETIVEQTNRANAMLEQMLEFAKLGSTEYALEMKEADLAECLRRVAADNYYRFEEKKMSLELQIPEEKVLCRFDEQQLKRLLFNLIGNVIQHNPEDTSVQILLRESFGLPGRDREKQAEQKEKTEEKHFGKQEEKTIEKPAEKGAIARLNLSGKEGIVIWIADNGPLVDDKLKDQLFEPFRMGDESRNTKGGSGLGLSVAKRIAELHHGTLEYRETLMPGYKGFVLFIPKDM